MIVVGTCSPQSTKVFTDSAGSSPATRSIIYGYAASLIAVSGKTAQSIIGPVSLATPKLILAHFAGASSTCRVNGVSYGTFTLSGEGFAGITIGSSYSHSAGLTGSIALVAIYSRALTSSEINTLETYTMSYYTLN